MTTDVLTLQEAAQRYAEARVKLPPPGQPLQGPEDAANFKAFTDALVILEQAALTHAGLLTEQSA